MEMGVRLKNSLYRATDGGELEVRDDGMLGTEIMETSLGHDHLEGVSKVRWDRSLQEREAGAREEGSLEG